MSNQDKPNFNLQLGQFKALTEKEKEETVSKNC